MSNSKKIRNNFFKFILVIIAAGVPIIITSSYKTELVGKNIGFQKSINRLPVRKEIVQPHEMERMYQLISEQ